MEEIEQLEARLDNQISKTNNLEKELEALKKENSFLKQELKSKLNNVKTLIDKNNDELNKKVIDCNEENVGSNLDFHVVRDVVTDTPQSVLLNRDRETPKKDYCTAAKRTVEVPTVSPQVPISSAGANVAINEMCRNHAYPLKPTVKRKPIVTSKPNLLVVGDSHIKRVDKDLIVYHLNDKNVSLKCKNFDGADVRKIQHHLLPHLHEDQLDCVIIHGGTNDITPKKIHSTRPHDLASKIIEVGNVCKSFGISKIAISSILPRKDQECQKRIDETNNYLKDMCGFYGFCFIDNSNISDSFLHHDELHLNKVGSFLLGQNFVKYLNDKYF